MDVNVPLIPVVSVGVAGLLLGFVIYVMLQKLSGNKRLRRAELAAQTVVDEAKKQAELMKKSAILEAKDEWFKVKDEVEKKLDKTRKSLEGELQHVKQTEANYQQKQKYLERREGEIASREGFLSEKEKALRIKESELSKTIQNQNEKLQSIAHLSEEQARKQLLENLNNEVRQEAAQMIKKIKDEARENAEHEAQKIVVTSIQRLATEWTVDSTVSTVNLPSDDIKGRIIGREGRNIRAFEEITGVDVIVDDTPDSVVLSCFEPVKREVARLALERLVLDGRIHPTRIEEVVNKVKREIEAKIKELGEEATLDLGVQGLHPELILMLGRLHYRTSFGQNVLKHSKEVARLAFLMSAELKLDANLAKRAGLLHDIGKAVDREMEGTHAMLGGKFAEKYGEKEIICNAIAGHHEDIEPISLYPIVIQAADAVSATRPGARMEAVSTYVQRVEKLEAIADSFRGVEKSYTLSAGREVRVMVQPEEMNDAQAEELATQISKKIETDMDYPGQIKVTIIREKRFTEYAK